VVYPVGPGSPAGIEPPAANTIPQSFDNQIRKANLKAERHADTKARIIQFLAPPPSHHDPLRVTPVDQLAALPDPELVDKALQMLTTDNFSGSISLPDGSAVSMRDCILEFVGNSRIREGREIKTQLNERLGVIKALLNVTWNDLQTSRLMTGKRLFLTMISPASDYLMMLMKSRQQSSASVFQR
jgi:hypothetical protein